MVISLSNKHKLTFPDKLKGKHIIAIRKLQGSMINNAESGDVSIESYFDNLYKLFEVLCEKIETENGEVKPSIDYLENLEQDDFVKIEEYLIEASQFEIDLKKK